MLLSKADNQDVNKLVWENEILKRRYKSHQIFVSITCYQYFEMFIKHLHAHHSLSIWLHIELTRSWWTLWQLKHEILKISQ